VADSPSHGTSTPELASDPRIETGKQERAIRNLFLAAIALCLAACGCGNEAAISRVEALSQPQLASLAVRLTALEAGGSRRLEGRRLPPGFEDIAPDAIWVAPGRSTVVLAGCVDDKATLQLVEGADGRRVLVLSPGEIGPEKQLWASADAPKDVD
jgi:hypothetical protein